MEKQFKISEMIPARDLEAFAKIRTSLTKNNCDRESLLQDNLAGFQ